MFSKKFAGLLAVAGLFVAGTASAQIVGTAHDLQAEIASLDDICTICHAPHNNLNADGEMLWNHAASTIATYTVYSSPTLDPGANPGQPGATSLLCLSCHDGSVAVDSFGTATGTLFIDNAAFTTGQTPFGSSLGNDHPIGLTYVAGVSNEMNAVTTPVTFGDGTSGTVDDLLFGGVVECGSCHDVHGSQSGGSGGNASLLRVANTNSGLCTACHTK